MNCSYLALFNFLLIVLLSTFVPFCITWVIKHNCPNRHLSFRFISRKWIITIIPCALIVFLVTEDTFSLNNKLVDHLTMWAISTSILFLLGEHIAKTIDKIIAIKYKDINIEFKKGANNDR